MKSLTRSTFISCYVSYLFTIAHAQSCSPLDNVKITFFGYPDNSPPGAGLAFTQCGHSLAGGVGTYDDPISFATATDGDFTVCDIVYLPWVRKYARYEDDCEQCKTDWDSSHEYHIDLWTGSTYENGEGTQTDCENSLPGGPQTIVRHPPNNLPTETTPFYDNGNCNKKTYPVGTDSSLCTGGGAGSGGGSSSTATTSFTSTIPVATLPPSTLMTSTTTASGGTQCSWAGHCLGAPCNDYNDCDGQLICTNKQCAPVSS